MTIILKQYNYRNSRNTATILMQNYWNKFDSVSFWRVLIKYDNRLFAQTLKAGLLNRPKATNYIYNN